MALVIKDRVKETTTTTGSSDAYVLAGAVSGFETFTANLSNSDTTYYVCTDNTDFEIGLGTFTSSGTTLARTTILASSNSNNAVNWSSGTRTIFMTYPADKAVFKDASNNINGTFVGNITGNVTGNVSGTAATVTGAAQTNITSIGTLASNLNLGGQDIVTTTSNQDIDFQTHGTGKVVIKGNTDDSGSNPGAIKLNCEANSHGQTIIAAPHSESASNTLTLPSSGGNARLVTTSSTATLTNKTFDVEGTGNSISNIDVADLKSGVLDTDISSVSGSDDTLASAKAIKTYVDAQVTAQDLDLTTDSGTIAIDLDSETLTVTGGTGIDTSASGNEVTIAGSDASTSSKGIASFSDTFFSVSSGAVSLDAAQTGITSVVNTALEIGRDADNRIKFGTDNQIIFEVDGGDNVIFKTSGEIEATSLDISGDADIDGTALNTVIAGVTVANATTAAVATTVTISDNESTNEENAVVFTAGGDVDGGNIGLESDGDLTYNPSTGTISATVFKGNIDAVDGDFDGTLEADAITVGGTALNTVIAGVTVTNATNSAHVLVTDNESTNEENLITFVEDATSSTGNVGLEMDGHLTYNPSTGTVTATVFKGNIDAVDGDFDGTLEADAITVNGTALNTVIADEATALAIALG